MLLVSFLQLFLVFVEGFMRCLQLSYMIRVLKYDIQGLSKCELSTPGDEAQFAGGRITQVAKENYEKWATENQGEIARQVCALPIQISCLPTSATNDAHCS